MTRLISAIFGSAALLLAGCGGEASSDGNSTERVLIPCLTESEFVFTLAPITLDPNALNIGTTVSSGSVGGISMTSLSFLDISGLDLGDAPIVISGHSHHQNTQTAPLSDKAVAKDGISINLGGGTGSGGGDGGGGGISVPTSDTETCTPVESITFLADGLADHATGSFPNAENPYAISEQTRELTVTLTGGLSLPIALTPDRLDGILLNGVPIQMREASCAGTQCSAAGGDANPLHAPALYGIDAHNAHVLSDGSYHYHGDPDTLYDDTGISASPVIGFAADGVPIFGPWIDDGGIIRKATSSYQLKTGSRPAPDDGFNYDGTFAQDYEYVHASGDLDICNGMFIDGIYGYVVTDTFPYILNCLRREPDPSFSLE